MTNEIHNQPRQQYPQHAPYPHQPGGPNPDFWQDESNRSGNRLPPGHLHVTPMKFEPQPWVKGLGRWLRKNTIGVARVDLKRPLPPTADQYKGNNLFLATCKEGSSQTPGQNVRSTAHPTTQGNTNRSQPLRAGLEGLPSSNPGDPSWHPQTVQHPQQHTEQNAQQNTQQHSHEHHHRSSGARVKIMRSLVLGRELDADGYDEVKPLFDLGAGLNIDMDRQKFEPVLRFKMRDFFSLKALPHPLLKLSRDFPVFNTGMSLKVHYEVPLEELHHFYQPPARLMVRLDQAAGSGFHVTPSGLEFDQKTVRFGRNVALRTCAGLAFPRSLPFDPDEDNFDFKVHRLSLKALW